MLPTCQARLAGFLDAQDHYLKLAPDGARPPDHSQLFAIWGWDWNVGPRATACYLPT